MNIVALHQLFLSASQTVWSCDVHTTRVKGNSVYSHVLRDRKTPSINTVNCTRGFQCISYKCKHCPYAKKDFWTFGLLDLYKIC